jgi:hypothetical protein
VTGTKPLQVQGGDPSPILELVEETLGEVAPFILGAVVWDRVSAVAFGRDHGLDISLGDLFADGVGIVTTICEEGLDLVADHAEHHAEQRRKTMHIVGLARRQYEAERETPGIASGVELGSEAAARSAKRLGFLSALFMPTAQ